MFALSLLLISCLQPVVGSSSVCDPLPSFFSHALDDHIAEKYIASFSDSPSASLRDWTPLLDRTKDSPIGTHLSSAPLVGGVFIQPPHGAQPLDLERFDKMLVEAADTGKDELNVLTLGGSMTVGSMTHIDDIVNSNCWADLHGNGTGDISEETGQPDWTCWESVDAKTGLPNWQEHLACKPCVWPARFESWLKGAYPKKKVNVYNLARGGLGTTAFVGMLTGLLEFRGIANKLDLVIINFSFNDQIEVRIDLSASGKLAKATEGLDDKEKQHLANMYDQLRKDKMRRDFEALLRLLLQLPTSPAVLNLELGGDHMPNGVYALHAEALDYYRIPTLSWTQASKALVIHSQNMHPTWHTHQILADYIAYTWTRLAELTCERITKQGDELTTGHFELPPAQWQDMETGFCIEESLTFYDAQSTRALGDRHMIPTAISTEGPEQGWRFGADFTGNGKMGWWMDMAEGGKIVFEVQVRQGASSIGGLGYLLSWSKEMGAATVSFLEDPPGREMVVDGFYDCNGVQASVNAYRRLCYDPSPEARKYDLEMIDGRTLIKMSTDKPTTPFPTGSKDFVMPDCDYEEEPEDKEYAVVTRHLQIHILPRPEVPEPRKTVHNKFVIRYISTC